MVRLSQHSPPQQGRIGDQRARTSRWKQDPGPVADGPGTSSACALRLAAVLDRLVLHHPGPRRPRQAPGQEDQVRQLDPDRGPVLRRRGALRRYCQWHQAQALGAGSGQQPSRYRRPAARVLGRTDRHHHVRGGRHQVSDQPGACRRTDPGVDLRLQL